MRFEPGSVKVDRIKEDAEYAGICATFTGTLGSARIPMQIDVGFGDVMYPGAEERAFPTILDAPAPRLRTYPRETDGCGKVPGHGLPWVAQQSNEGLLDIWLLSRQFDFEGPRLATAIARTFERRQTSLQPNPLCLTPAFMAGEHGQRQWSAFARRLALPSVPSRLDELREPLRQFLVPIVERLVAESPATVRWIAPGPWG